MDQATEDLLRRIEDFEIDHPEATFPFSKRLAKENGWSADYTERVIHEYKRFAFLFVATGHPVAPSEDVDEAWHLHMLYSENYWQEFCGKALGRPLHHRPSQGIAGDGAKFGDWYRDTLESYRRLIGTPPSDIWPDPSDKKTRAKPQKVDRSTHWVVRKPSVREIWQRLWRSRYPAIVGLAFVVIGCSNAAKGPNPLDWYGPDFLKLFMALYAGCFVVAWYVRRALMSTESAGEPVDLDFYEAAYLVGGSIGAFRAAVVRLVQREVITVDPTGARLAITGAPYMGDSETERNVYGFIASGKARFIRYAPYLAAHPTEHLMNAMISRGLWTGLSQRLLIAAIPFVISMLPVVLGVVKIAVGISRHRPVDYLIALCFIGGALSFLSFARRPLRTLKGDEVREGLVKQHSSLKDATYAQLLARSARQPDSLALAVGFYGAGVLVASPHKALGLALGPPSPASSDAGGSGSGGSSCGTSGCGGGGGGGCGGGGGGCGGCGGH